MALTKPVSADFQNARPPRTPMLLQLRDFGTSLWQLIGDAISLPESLKGE
jgi:hypothetical protein